MNIKASPPSLVQPTITYGALIGKIVLHHRKLRGIDQAAVAAALGVTQSAYSKLELGQTSMTVTQLRMIAESLGLAPQDLLGEVEMHATHLRAQGVEVKNEREVSPAGLLVGLGILAALLAAAG